MNAVNVYLIIRDVNELILFTENVFGATVINKVQRENGSISHAEIKIRDAVIMATEPSNSLNYFPASMYVYVSNCDDTLAKALEAGADIVMLPVSKPQNNERYCAVQDTNGNVWWITGKIK